VSGAVTALVIFKGHFYADLSGFLFYIVVWLGPWFGIMTVDFLMRRGEYDTQALDARGGVYWRNGGFNWKALVALAAGMFAAMMWINAEFFVPSYTGPISNATHGGDLSWLFGMVVAAAIYYVLSIRSIPVEQSRMTPKVSSVPQLTDSEGLPS
jgi:NCS1 family nucleobase:cation symporter-1